MSKTFLQATTRLMGLIDRPMSETDVVDEAKESINDAISFLQRNHAFHFTERITEFTYPASALTVNLTSVCEGVLRDIHSFQLIQADGNGGPILEYKTYNQIQALRRKYQRTHPNWTLDDEWEFICTNLGHETYTQRVHKFYVFKMGEDVGLYPTPTQDVVLLMNAHIWLPELVEDGDTNFFLTYAYDTVMTIALRRMSIYMKEDNRYGVTNEEVAQLAAGLIQWDSQVAQSPYTAFP